jgi:hypothetical protein
MWFAKPSLQWTCTIYSLPVFTGAHLETVVTMMKEATSIRTLFKGSVRINRGVEKREIF